jgi:hypothetical protein
LDPGTGGETFFYKNDGGNWYDVSEQVPGSEQTLGHFEYPPQHTGSHWTRICSVAASCTRIYPSSEDVNHLHAKYDPVLP